MPLYICLYCFQTTTSANVDRFTKGLKGSEFFRVKVSLEKSTNVKETFAYMELLQHFMVRVKGGMSLRNGMWYGLRHAERNICRIT